MDDQQNQCYSSVWKVFSADFEVKISRYLVDVKCHNFCRAGAELRENCAVKDATFNKEEGLWKVFLEDSESTYEVSDCAIFR